MFMIDPIEYAPEWLKNVAAAVNGMLPFPIINPKAVAFVRIYENPTDVRLRNKVDETKNMLRGLVHDLEAPVLTAEFFGHELKNLGFDPVGAQFVQKFCVLII